MNTLTQLNPSIPLMTPKGGGEAIAVIDYGPEHDLLWVVIEDTTGEVWTHPNRNVKGYKNYSIGRNFQSDDDGALFRAFLKQWFAQPVETENRLKACLSEDHVRLMIKRIMEGKVE